MAVEYSDAPEVRQIAEELISAYHPHLADEEITYVFRSKAANKGSKIVLAMARKIRGLVSFLSRKSDDDYFLMEVAFDTWGKLNDTSKKAVVDHELCHFGITEDGVRYIIPHDLEEFNAVVQRYGLWREGQEFQV